MDIDRNVDIDRGEVVGVQKLLRALVLLAIANREEAHGDDRDRRKTEVLLYDAGFTLTEIAQLAGRPYQTIKSIVRRGKSKG